MGRSFLYLNVSSIWEVCLNLAGWFACVGIWARRQCLSDGGSWSSQVGCLFIVNLQNLLGKAGYKLVRKFLENPEVPG